jgi:hypothetical protein
MNRNVGARKDPPLSAKELKDQQDQSYYKNDRKDVAFHRVFGQISRE